MSMSKYRELFVSESRRHLASFNDLIIQIENDTNDQNAVNELFRHAHSMKGMAATMQFRRISELAHKMEDLLSRVRNHELNVTPAIADILLEGSDQLNAMISIIETDADGTLPDCSQLIKRLINFKTDENETNQNKPAETNQHQFRQSDSLKTVRIKTDILDRLVNITGELITTRHHLASQIPNDSDPGVKDPLNRMSRLLRELRNEVFNVRMLPFSTISERFPRLVRDLARSQEKEVSFEIRGGEIELDRGILEDISEPLIHILRNAIDHGLERPEQRKALGKNPCGKISILVKRSKDHVNISISDDGNGMTPAALAARAVEKGLITPEQADTMGDEERLNLICMPGFSTANTVTNVSGRGVGMDVVKTAIQGMGGSLAIHSSQLHGSCFTLELPLTVSIINVLLVESGQFTLAFPVTVVEHTIELTAEQIFEENGQSWFSLDGNSTPLTSLRQIFGQANPPASAYTPVILGKIKGVTTGIVCDRIIGQQEIFTKPLAKPFSSLKHTTAGAIMGNGTIVFILDMNSLPNVPLAKQFNKDNMQDTNNPDSVSAM